MGEMGAEFFGDALRRQVGTLPAESQPGVFQGEKIFRFSRIFLTRRASTAFTKSSFQYRGGGIQDLVFRDRQLPGYAQQSGRIPFGDFHIALGGQCVAPDVAAGALAGVDMVYGPENELHNVFLLQGTFDLGNNTHLNRAFYFHVYSAGVGFDGFIVSETLELFHADIGQKGKMCKK